MISPRRLGLLVVAQIVLVAAASPRLASAGTCYVAPPPVGNDGTAVEGSKDFPFATVGAPVEVARTSGRTHCGTIVVDSGNYPERIVIRNHRPPPGLTTPLVIKASQPYSPSEPTWGAFIRGELAPVDASLARQAAIAIYDSSYIEIRGLHITEDATVYCTAFPDSTSKCNNAGIDIRNGVANGSVGKGPSSHHIIIRGNEFAHVRAATVPSLYDESTGVLYSCTPETPDCIRHFDAVPLDIYSDRNTPDESTHHIEVLDNVFRDCDLNSDINGTPAVLVSRNVEDVRIEGNAFHDLVPTSVAVRFTLGITVRGERFVVAPAEQPESVEVHARARKVVIRNNSFVDIQGTAVFIQSANTALIERNLVERTTYGIQIATEGTTALAGVVQAKTRSRMIWARDNVLRDVQVWAIDVGQKTDHSPVDDIYVTNNTIVRGEATPIDPTYPTHANVLRPGIGGDSSFANNISELRGADLDCQASGQLAGCNFLVLWSASSTTMIASNNLWDEGAPASFIHMFCRIGLFNCAEYASFAAPVGPESSGIHADPALTGTYTISAGSPARDAGAAVFPSWVAENGTTSDSLGAYLETFGDHVTASQYAASYPELDFFGNPRVLGPYPDIGAHEYSP